MTDRLGIRLDAALALSVTAAGLSPWPWLALVVCAVFLIGNAVLIDRRTPPGDTP